MELIVVFKTAEGDQWYKMDENGSIQSQEEKKGFYNKRIFVQDPFLWNPFRVLFLFILSQGGAHCVCLPWAIECNPYRGKPQTAVAGYEAP